MKEQLREYIFSLGADLCGFAGINRFADAPEGFKPSDIWSECKSVISLAVALPKGLGRINPRLIYSHYNSFSCLKIESIAFNASKYIEANSNYSAIPIPCDSPYEYWNEDFLEGRGLLSMKHIAVQAGLGTIGENTLLMCEEFGNMVTLGCVLTNCEIESDNLTGNICIDNCNKCITACPVNAINNNSVNQKLCRKNTYGKTRRGFDTVDCNMCRTICPMNNYE